MDELMRHQPLLTSSVMTSLIKVGSTCTYSVQCMHLMLMYMYCT